MKAFLPAFFCLPWLHVSAMLVGRTRLTSFLHSPASKTLEAAPIADHLHHHRESSYSYYSLASSVLFAKQSLRGGGDGVVDDTVASAFDGTLGDDEELDQVNRLMMNCFYIMC